MHVLGTINLLCNSFIKNVEFFNICRKVDFFKKQLFQGAKLEYTCFFCVKHILQNTLKSKSSKGLLHFLTFELSKAENSIEHHPSSLSRTILLWHLQVL